MNKSILLALLLSTSISADILMVDKGIYKVWYDSALEQPIKVSYFVTNRPKNVDRGGMNFYKDSNIHTSDNKDYYKNVWDKGHMAPAAHFSDSKENLKNTFSYLNSTLQHEELNRGAWRFLEAAVRKWSEKETLFVENIILFNEQSLILDSGATVPQAFQKNIYFTESDVKKCFFFLNNAQDSSWEEREVECSKEDKFLTSNLKCEKVDLFFIKPSNGFISKNSKFRVEFGSKNVLISPAGVMVDQEEGCTATGHHHLIINNSYDVIKNIDMPIPFAQNVLHFGGGQTQADLTLPPGKYTLQLALGDYEHKPVKSQEDNSLVVSDIINIEILR